MLYLNVSQDFKYMTLLFSCKYIVYLQESKQRQKCFVLLPLPLCRNTTKSSITRKRYVNVNSYRASLVSVKFNFLHISARLKEGKLQKGKDREWNLQGQVKETSRIPRLLWGRWGLHTRVRWISCTRHMPSQGWVCGLTTASSSHRIRALGWWSLLRKSLVPYQFFIIVGLSLMIILYLLIQVLCQSSRSIIGSFSTWGS